MRTYWENSGQPLADSDKEHAGEYAAVIDPENGKPKQRFYGKTEKEVADKLLEAQGNATATILELKAKLPSEQPEQRPKKNKLERKPLNAGERMQVANDMTDPTKAPEAVARIVESEIGASLSEVRERLNSDAERSEFDQAREAAAQFARATPEYFSCPGNDSKLVRYMQVMNYSPLSAKNYRIAFDELSGDGLLLSRPAEPSNQPSGSEGQPEDGASHGTRPRGAATFTSGLRTSDASGTPGTRRPQKYTREQIEAMPAKEYEEKLKSEPGFAQAVDTLYSSDRQAAPAARA